MNSLQRFFLSRYLQTPKRHLLRFSFVFMVAGIVLSVAILSAGLNLFEGYESTLKSLLLDSYAHIGLQSSSGSYLTREETDTALAFLAERPEIKSAVPSIQYSLMAQGEDKIRSASLRGYDFAQEFPYATYVTQGTTMLKPGEVIIGHYLAQDLGLGLGDELKLIYPQLNRISAMGVYTGQQRYRIAGIYRSGFYENDRSMVITTITDAEALLLISDSYSRIEIRLKDADRADHFSRVYTNLLGEDYVTLPWTIFASSLMRLIAMEKWLIFIIFCFLVLIAGINVISAVSTIILDKAAEIAVLKSLGADPREVKNLYAYKVGIIAVSAVVLGQAFGALLSWIVEKQGIYKLKGDVYFIDTLGGRITPINLLAVFTVSTILIWLCIRIPLKQIDRLQIIDLIRQKA